MKRNFSSSDESKNWEQIVSDAFSPHAEPHIFSARYERKKQDMEEMMMAKRKIKAKKPMMIAAAVLAAIVVIPSSAYAASRMYRASLEPKSNYQQNVLIDVGETQDSQIMALQVGWMPDGIATDDDGFKYHDAQDEQRSVTVCFYKVKDGENCLEVENKNIISQRTETIHGNQVFFLQRDTTMNGNRVCFDKVVWVAFTDTNYAAELFATTGMTEDELEQIVENLSLTPSDTETAGEWVAEETEINDDGEEDSAEMDSIEYNTYEIGETIPVTDNMGAATAQMTVDSISIQDDFGDLPSVDCIGLDRDYQDFQKEDGTIVDNIRTWYRVGDGVNTLDAVWKQETKTQKVIVLHLTYTNNGTKSIEECVCPYLFQMGENGEILSPCEEETDAEDYFYNNSCDLNYDGKEFFLFWTESNHTKNNLILRAGESAEATVAFAMNADEMENLYMMVDGSDMTVVNLQSDSESEE